MVLVSSISRVCLKKVDYSAAKNVDELRALARSTARGAADAADLRQKQVDYSVPASPDPPGAGATDEFPI